MQIRFFLTSILFLSIAAASNAQMEKTIHQTFPAEEAKTITLDLYGDYEIVAWAGNTVMTETNIQLSEASPSILTHFVDKMKRYYVEADTSASSLQLHSFDKKREKIQFKGNVCYETVHMKVYMPDKFKKLNDNVWAREEEK